MTSLEVVRPAIGASADGDRGRTAQLVTLVLGGLLGVVFLISLGSGASDSSALNVAWGLVSGDWSAVNDVEKIVVLDVRLPRAILAVFVGASLALSGALMQGLFRNPLADPGIVGVSAGGALGAVTVIVLGSGALAPMVALFGVFHVPVAAFFGSLISTYVLYRISTRRGRTSVATMLLAGIALNALAFAMVGLLIFRATEPELRDLTFWNLGSLAGATWSKTAAIAPIIVPIVLAAPLMARALNAMTLGEASAHHLGVSVQRFKRAAIVAVAAAAGAAVAVSGGIGFVGIVVPHLLRLLIGPDHRYLLPNCALLGGIMLLLADVVARQIVMPAELPIGIVTASVGAPFFLWILLRRQGVMDL